MEVINLETRRVGETPVRLSVREACVQRILLGKAERPHVRAELFFVGSESRGTGAEVNLWRPQFSVSDSAESRRVPYPQLLDQLFAERLAWPFNGFELYSRNYVSGFLFYRVRSRREVFHVGFQS